MFPIQLACTSQKTNYLLIPAPKRALLEPLNRLSIRLFPSPDGFLIFPMQLHQERPLTRKQWRPTGNLGLVTSRS